MLRLSNFLVTCPMLRLFLFLALSLCLTACQKEGVRSCGTDVSSTAFVDVVNFRDTLELGEHLTVVMDFFPQDDRGKLLVLPPDIKLHWGVYLRREDRYVSSTYDTIIAQVEAEKGTLEEVGINSIGISCSRNGNMQQANFRFSVLKPGLYTMSFFIDRSKSSTQINQWKKCLSYLVFESVNVVQPKGIYPNERSLTFYVKP